MLRRIIKIDEDKCNGCGACAAACHEGAIGIEDGKARLLREDYCDGLGDCLPECPTGAIRFEEREAPAYNEAAVLAAKRKKEQAGCPGARAQELCRAEDAVPAPPCRASSRLAQWPCQIKLAPLAAPYFKDAELLVAADCTAYACASIHEDFMKGRVTLIGCPKLDGVDYSEKLAAILKNNTIRSVTVLRMEVPCCGGLKLAVKRALQAAGKPLPCRIVTFSVRGEVLADKDGGQA